MKKILFLIHDLGEGGAEKVLLNLVNNMDRTKFDITVMTLFDYGVNRQFIAPHIKYKTWCKNMVRGNSYFIKLFTPSRLHKMIIKEQYDIEVAYLEGPCARVISGCEDKDTKKVAWIHIEQHGAKQSSTSFRSIKEAKECYNKFERIICVSEMVKKCFGESLSINKPVDVYYNTNESKKILEMSKENVENNIILKDEINIIGVGKLLEKKGFDRMLRITKKLVSEGYPIHLYILGIGPKENELRQYILEHKLKNNATLLGYKTNPYKYVSKCDLFLCASHAEGFSTAATEALIVGTPVCTVDVSGMKEMLGENNEYGIVVENSEDALYRGVKDLIDSKEKLDYYREKAKERGKDFNTYSTVKAVEDMLLDL